MTIQPPATPEPTGARMRFYRHLGDGSICWTYPSDTGGTVSLHYRSPRPHEGPGIIHCGYRHDDPGFLTELPEDLARRLLSPDSGRDALIEHIHNTIDWDFIEVFTGEGEPGYPNYRSVCVQVADSLIANGLTATG